LYVTGVQTCALPIFKRISRNSCICYGKSLITIKLSINRMRKYFYFFFKIILYQLLICYHLLHLFTSNKIFIVYQIIIHVYFSFIIPLYFFLFVIFSILI